ncbi:MAG: glycoside hydrolase family 2, partial [Bacteroidales bacterium]|nr:glycoside hydrolase family 2 [Bacteroidales bacterium]
MITSLLLALAMFLLPNPYGREQVSLNGEWSAIVDQYEVGTGKRMWLDREPADKSEFIEYSWNGALKLDVPGDWNHQVPELWRYEGTVWYARHFEAQPDPDKRYILYFAGVSHRCEVWLNGRRVVAHEGSFTPFQADVTRELKAGDNFLVVRVHNNRREDAIPAMSFDWWNYGGITRDVMLFSVPQLYVSDYFVRLKEGTTDTIAADIEVNPPFKGVEVNISIPELKLKGKAKTDEKGIARFQLKPRKLRLWNPLEPKLYDVVISTAEDRVSDLI